MLERTILLDGLSKTYAMTGWRCGFAAVPDELVDPLTRFFVNSTSCVPGFVQLAGVAALRGPQDEPRAMVEEFRARRSLVVEGLNRLPGVTCRMPRGAFYAFPNVADVPIDADELASRLLEEAGVAVLAGSAFGTVGKDNLRLSYANSRENLSAALERMDALPGEPLVTLELVTAGESHGPALVAVLTGLPAGLELDRAAIDHDLARRREGYGRSPRQKLEQDEVEVLAGLRHGKTLGTPLALVIRNRDHSNWTWGMSPWPPEGEPSGKGTSPVHLPRPGHADLAGVLKYGHEDVRNALERASARQTAAHVAAGAVAKALLAEIGIAVAGSVREIGGATTQETMREATDAARGERDTLGGVVEVAATGVPPGLGSYAEKRDRLDARLAAALMGIQAVKGVEVGDGFELARRRGSEAHDEIEPGLRRSTNRAGGMEGGMSNGEAILVRAAMKPLPTLMRPLGSVDLATGEPGQALVERSDVQAVEALAVVAEAAVAWELARAAREKFGGDALTDFVAAHVAYLERIRWPR